ncbi:MAG: phosphatase PAP2 family protein [Vicinamibacterales bacterium]
MLKFIASVVIISVSIGSSLIAQEVTGVNPEPGATTLFSREPDPQAPQIDGPPPTPRHTGIKAMIKQLGPDLKQLPSKENLYWALGGGAAALAVHPADEYVQQHMLGNRLADDIFKPGQVLGIVGPWAGSIATYAWGRIKDQPKVSHVGMDLIQSQLIAAGLTQGLKYATQRERPDGSGATSFPSGHASGTFAFATALERHLGWRYAVPAYVAASYVAASRLPSNRHWLSDVVFGATVGIISGRTVTSKEAQPYPISVHPLPGGAVVAYSPARFNR